MLKMNGIIAAVIQYQLEKSNEAHIIYGANHSQCINFLFSNRIIRNKKYDIQGFLYGDSFNNYIFVNSREAYIIAKNIISLNMKII